MPAIPACILEPSGTSSPRCCRPARPTNPLGCHRQRLPDRIIFDKLIQVLVFGCGYRRIADHTCSATTLRRRRDEWIALGVAERLHRLALAAYDRMHGLEMDHLAVDGCITKAPCGGQTAGPSPVDRRKQGLKRSVATDAHGVPLAALPAPANRRDDGLLATTLDAAATVTAAAVGPLPEQLTVHSDTGYDCQPCRQVLPTAAWSARSPPVGCQHRSRLAEGGRSSAPMPGPTRTASCVGVPSAARSWSRSGCCWPWR